MIILFTDIGVPDNSFYWYRGAWSKKFGDHCLFTVWENNLVVQAQLLRIKFRYPLLEDLCNFLFMYSYTWNYHNGEIAGSKYRRRHCKTYTNITLETPDSRRANQTQCSLTYPNLDTELI
jgi:hypothetical protein